MIKIALFSYLSSIQILITGYLFYIFSFKKELDSKINIFEFGFYGIFLLSFISIFLNFFIGLSREINNIIFLFPLLIFFFFFNKNIFIKIITFSIPIAFLFVLTISYDTIYRPDAGLYHLPYVSIINESKIIIGVNNLHFRFGHTSIMQYLSALFNNHLFLNDGILIPLGLIYCHSLGYLIFEIFNKKNKDLIIIFFSLFAFSIFLMNRYGDFGNDAPAHFLFFYLICESLKENDILYKIKKTTLISTFIFLNKVTLLLCFFVPIYFIIKNFKLKYIVNKINIFSFIFLFLFLLKNFLVSGCLIFPVEQTCIKETFWYDYGSKRNSNAINTRLENEAWAKGWPDQENPKKDFEVYLSDYNWIYTWSKNHGKYIIKKISPFLIFMCLIIATAVTYEIKNNNYKKKEKERFLTDSYFLCFICISGVILWFLKFPVFRYGYSYIACGLSLILYILLRNFTIFTNLEKFKKILVNILFLLLLSISIKNIARIYPNLLIKNEKKTTEWPNIYSENKNIEKIDNIAIYKNGQFLFYKSREGSCYYTPGPCTHYFYNADFTLDEINLEIINTYKVFFFKRNLN
jgi:hypothetical protein